MKKVVVVLPTFNEEENIEDVITLILAQQKKVANWEIFVLVTDSHSEDNTQKIVAKLVKANHHLELIDVQERGIGVGLVHGYRHAFDKMKADAVIQMDADLQHDTKEIPNFLLALDEGYDFIQGSRFIKGGKNELEWYRKFFSWSANWFSRLLLGIYRVHEFTTSYRAFTREIFTKTNLNDIPWQGRSFVFQPAFLYAVHRAHARIKEIPIVFVDRSRGLSKMQILKYIKDLMVFGIKARIKKYKRFVKFGMVGTVGFIINTIGLEVFVKLGLHPSLASAIGAEGAIISNFLLNNHWTFKERKIHRGGAPLKFLQFNLTSLGALLIQSGTVFLGVTLLHFGAYRIFYLFGVGFGMFWNYFMYSNVIWSKNKESGVS